MNPFSLPKSGAEISDRIVHFNPETLERLPVRKADVVNEFLAAGNHRAARIVEKLSDNAGVLDSASIDRLLIAVHCEMQQLSEEFQHGHRTLELLKPLVGALRSCGVTPIRVVDIGCGTGFVIRWLADMAGLGDDVEWIGADYNAGLIAEARRLAQLERIQCNFVVANAFRLPDAASIYISTGFVHHFRGNDLVQMFEQHSRAGACAFAHWDFQASAIAPLGSWLFHEIRMRQRLSKHDGVLSAARAYTAKALLDAGRSGAPEFLPCIYNARVWKLPIKRVFHCLLGVQAEFRDTFKKLLGAKASRLEEPS